MQMKRRAGLATKSTGFHALMIRGTILKALRQRIEKEQEEEEKGSVRLGNRNGVKEWGHRNGVKEWGQVSRNGVSSRIVASGGAASARGAVRSRSPHPTNGTRQPAVDKQIRGQADEGSQRKRGPRKRRGKERGKGVRAEWH